jgi:hypothetical protein
MKHVARASVAIAVLIVSAVSPAWADSVLIGTPPDVTGNCAPFGCAPPTTGSSRYQQVYSALAFPGALLINEVQFYLTVDPGGYFNSGIYQFFLSTTQKGVNELDSDFDANRGADNALFAVVPFHGTAAVSFSVPGLPFPYDPANGNLLLDIVIQGRATHVGDEAFFDARNGTSGGVFSRNQNFVAVQRNYGLVTGFVDAAAPVPEPASMFLVASGVLGVCLRCWKRRGMRPSGSGADVQCFSRNPWLAFTAESARISANGTQFPPRLLLFADRQGSLRATR